MRSCPSCKNQITRQPLYQLSAFVCYHCHSIGFMQAALETLLKSAHFQGLEKKGTQKINFSAPSCFYCSSPSQIVHIQPTSEHKENLRLFQNWKYWFDHHKKGLLQIFQCQKCHACWMSARTLCQFRIDWNELEIKHKEALNAAEMAGIQLSFDSPYRFVMGMLLGIPQLDNVPAFSELPLLTYLIAVVVGYATSRGFKDPEILNRLTFDPNHLSGDGWITACSYALVHENRPQFFGVIIFFLVFTPMVEHELSTQNFLILLVGSAAGSALIQAALLPHTLTGLGGVVSSVLAFFCLRFPSSVIGFGIIRFSAPVALALFIFFDFQSVVGSLQGNGDPAHLVNLGGAFLGYFFHMMFPRGKATEAFRKFGESRIQKERNARNWRTGS